MTGGTLLYTAELVESIARRVAELLREEPVTDDRSLIDASEAAHRFGVSRDYIYAHAAELGAVRLGDGPRARLRFDPSVVAERLGPRPDPRAVAHPPKPAPRRRTPTTHVPLLPIRRKAT